MLPQMHSKSTNLRQLQSDRRTVVIPEPDPTQCNPFDHDFTIITEHDVKYVACTRCSAKSPVWQEYNEDYLDRDDCE